MKITSVLQLAGIFILTVFVAGCATIQETYGISPTDLSSLHPGMKQSEVEKFVGNPIVEPENADFGYSVVYRFNRGYQPPDENKMSRAAVMELVNILSIGTLSLHTYDYQKALLHVAYDHDGKLIHAEESMEKNCSSYSTGASNLRYSCTFTQSNLLYPSTLPLSVLKFHQQQRSTPPPPPMPPIQ